LKRNFITEKLEEDELIIGLMLSDGHVSKPITNTSNCRFLLTQSYKHLDMINHTEKYLNLLGFKITRFFRIRRNCISVSISSEHSPDFTLIRKLWYNTDKKIIPRTINLTPKSLSFWFQGDGCSSYCKSRNEITVIFSTESFNLNDLLFIKEKLIELKIKSTIHKRRKGYNLRIKKSSVNYFLSLIKPYLLDCYKYKFKVMGELGRVKIVN